MIIDIENINDLEINDIIYVKLKTGNNIYFKRVSDDEFQVTGAVQKTLHSINADKTLEWVKYIINTFKEHGMISSITIKRNKNKTEYRSMMELFLKEKE
jgi:hypothetical protein